MIPATDILEDVPLAPRTTLMLGGRAAYYLCARSTRDVVDGLRWARQRGVPAGILGGGSNILVPDEGFDGLVIEMAQRGIHMSAPDRVEVAAGEDWDLFVGRCVAEDLAGLECLSGIPGRTGAVPIQNVGAYGQEVAETIEHVEVLDRGSLETLQMSAAECAFGYRDSLFKREPEKYVVLSVHFRLRPGGPPSVRYAELERALQMVGVDTPSLADVRDTVVALRRQKSMVIDFADPNHRSAGSFFVNPVVSAAQAQGVVDRALSEGIVRDRNEVPRWDATEGRVKLAAGWLIERAGIHKGMRRGQVGISSAHALALVHHGGGTTSELLALAEEVRSAVHSRFGIALEREPQLFAPRPDVSPP